jgi:hypothetical protein
MSKGGSMTDQSQTAPRHLCYHNTYGSPSEHPQLVMKKLGITYAGSTPQSVYDQWWFWFCSNVPEILPPYLTVLDDLDPQQLIRNGLSKEEADFITSRSTA